MISVDFVCRHCGRYNHVTTEKIKDIKCKHCQAYLSQQDLSGFIEEKE
jgi:hypothetical protein